MSEKHNYPRPRKPQAARRVLHTVNYDRLLKQCKTVLCREMDRLLDASHVGKLSKDESTALTAYFKLVGELKKQELADMENMTDEQLEKLVSNK